MDTCWQGIVLGNLQDGKKILSGGADNTGRSFDVTTGQSSQLTQHDTPIKTVRWIDTPQGGILATGSWDKTLKVRVCLRWWSYLHFRFNLLINLNTDRWMLLFRGLSSIGICERQTLSRRFSCLRGVIRWMLCIRLWLLELPRGISRFSTLPILRLRSRWVDLNQVSQQMGY